MPSLQTIDVSRYERDHRSKLNHFFAVLSKRQKRDVAYRNVCSWQVLGEGQFRPGENSQPFLGERDKIEQVPEFRVEMVCEDKVLAKAVKALRDSHPYEEPAYDYWQVNTGMPG